MFNHLTNIVEHNGKKYYVSTNDTFDHGLETMIFKVNKQIDDEYDINWAGLYVELYSSAEKAIERHNYICSHISEIID